MSMLRRGVLLGLLVLLLGSLAFSETEKRLIMKDGSYQKITKYEVQGDRVHYYSAERYEWEDVPSSLVDWNATKKYEQKLDNASAEQQARAAKEKAKREQEAALDQKDARSPEVAANLRLPETGGVFVVDQYGGSPQLVALPQDSSQTVDHDTAFILKHTVNPLASKKTTYEIPGAHSKIQLHVTRPAIYLNIDTDPDNDASSKRAVSVRRQSSDAYMFRLVKLDEKRDSRILATVSTDVADQATFQQKGVATVGELTPGDMWIKIEPKQDLAPGEYAVVQLLSGEEQINPYVWDFGVNPSAPQNAQPSKPGDKQANNGDDNKRLSE